jgi:hypothetical protein
MYSKELPSLKVQQSATTFQATRACTPLSNNMSHKIQPHSVRSVNLSNVMEHNWNISQTRPQSSPKETTCLANPFPTILLASLVPLQTVKKMEPTLNKWRTDPPLLVPSAPKKSRSLNKIFMKILAT